MHFVRIGWFVVEVLGGGWCRVYRVVSIWLQLIVCCIQRFRSPILSRLGCMFWRFGGGCIVGSVSSH